MRKLVFHDDRDIEFIAWKHQVQRYLASLPYDLGATSCEMLATTLYEEFDCSYVEVNEDGEAGAIIQRDSSLQLKLAWLAGIIDGEGSIGINRRNTNNTNGFVFGIYVSVGNTDKSMISNVAHIMEELAIMRTPRLYETKLKSWKPMYTITTTKRDEVMKLLQAIVPYLVTKKERAQLLIRWCESRLNQSKHQPNNNKLSWTDEENEIYKQIKILNRRGPDPAEIDSDVENV